MLITKLIYAAISVSIAISLLMIGVSAIYILTLILNTLIKFGSLAFTKAGAVLCSKWMKKKKQD